MALKISDKFVHPVTKQPLMADEGGNLYATEDLTNVLFWNNNGIYDFVIPKAVCGEREYYDDFYSNRIPTRSPSIEDCRRPWVKGGFKKRMLQSMGDLAGKRVLLLGAGISIDEFYFLSLGAECVYTDISLAAVKSAKTIFQRSEFARRGLDKMEFYAVDACRLPFPDNSIDVFYGCVFVHHIENLSDLFAEIARCLKPGGFCRFLDTAYSPLWQRLKKTVLKPLFVYVHKKQPVSPADMAATMRGGYRYEELALIKEAHAFKDMLYCRFAFFEYLFDRASLRMGVRFLRRLNPIAKGLDAMLEATTGMVGRHGIWLVWGFTK